VATRLLRFLIRTAALARKETLHILRDRQVVYLALGMPIVLVLLFGYAVTFDVDRIDLGLCDQDGSPASRALARALESGATFRLRGGCLDPERAETWVRRDEVKGIVAIPPDYARRIARREAARFQLLLDGSNGTVAQIALGYVAGAAQSQTARLLRQAGQSMRLPIEARIRTWFNPAMRSALFIVPGLLAIIVGVLAVLLSTLTVAREWERGSMEQLFATPVGRLSIVLGKMAPFVALGVLQFLLVLFAGAWLFDVPMRGSFAILSLAAVLFLVCALGQGLLISMVTRNQQVATQIGAVSSLLPAMLLSGFLFPVENMPLVLRVVSSVIPARYMIVVMRGVLLKGIGLAELWPPLLAMAGLGFALVAITTARFRRRID
jgi:ABC-2 type transport system permease protein